LLKKIARTLNAVISLKLREDLYTLAQMREGSLMQFFDVRCADGVWKTIDLNKTKELFCIAVAEKRLLELMVEMVPPERALPNTRPTPKLMLDVDLLNQSSNGGYVVNLVELTSDYQSLGARIVKERLTIENDLDAIYRHDFTGVFGSASKLTKRLTRYFDTGVNWDDQKSFVFPHVALPPPSKT
jgi:hypothetical protein